MNLAAYDQQQNPLLFWLPSCPTIGVHLSGRIAAEKNGLSDVQSTPELIELIKTTFRGVHVLAYLKREQLHRTGEQEKFRRAVRAAQTAQLEALPESDTPQS